MILTLILLSIAMIATALVTKKANYIVGDRNIGAVRGAMSIAATWIWAPALFVSSQQAFENGFVGFLFFLIPNILALLIYAPFAQRLRDRYPNGFNLPELIAKSKRTERLYRFNFSALSILSISVQLLAGSQIVSILTGWSFLLSSAILLGIALSYTLFRGFNSSVNTDMLQYSLIAVSSIVFLFFLDLTRLSFSGIAGNIDSFFSGQGLAVTLAFGIPVTIGLLSGPFGDGTFTQRALAIRKDKVKKAFILGGALFAVVPLALGLLGFAAAGAGFQPDNIGRVGLEFISSTMPASLLYLAFGMILAGLLSTIDSHVSFLSSLGRTRKAQLSLAILLPIISMFIASIPGNTVLIMFLFYGLFRASSLVTNMLFMWGARLREKTIFWSVFGTEILAFVPFAIGNFGGNAWLKIVGALLTVVIPIIIITALEKKSVLTIAKGVK